MGTLVINLLSANPTKWSNTRKQFVGKSRQKSTNCLSVFDFFVGFAFKGLMGHWNENAARLTHFCPMLQ